MVTPDEYVQKVIDVTLMKIKTDEESSRLLAQRSEIIWDWHAEHCLSPHDMETTIKNKLTEQGVSPDKFKGLGLTRYSIRTIVEHPRP